MYFPYFRGRQYDLLALRELAQKEIITDRIFPIVEPVKISSTLNGTIKAYAENKLKLAMILNPTVKELQTEDYEVLYGKINEYIIPAVIMNEDAEFVIRNLERKGIDRSNVLVLLNNRDDVGDYRNLFDCIKPAYTLFSDERSIRRVVGGNKVLFEDKFNKKSKNADYEKNNDEFFSEDHLFYREEGYAGFGDYSIIGKNYDESGFAPRAVAIHIVYIDEDSNFRVHHFVSNSNFGIEDIAGKYYEAVLKLKDWYIGGHKRQKTYGLSVFLEHADNGYFPGLPTVKKLSIMHHLELVNRVLCGVPNK